MIWKEFWFNGKYRPEVPEGETKFSGPCFRNALFEAGIDTDLPHWIRTEDVGPICDDLGLLYYMPPTPAQIDPDGLYIVGYITDRSKSLLKGHVEYVTDIESALRRIQENLSFIIEIP